MEVSEAPLLGSILWFLEEQDLLVLPAFLWQLARDIVTFPPLVAVITLVILSPFLYRFWRLVVPLSAKDRYRNAKELYRRGKQVRALKEWSQLDNFGPAYLSLATQAMYVEYDAMKALGVIRKAKEKRVRINLAQANMIRMDAKSLQQGGGNVAMLDMNARTAKQDHLGIAPCR